MIKIINFFLTLPLYRHPNFVLSKYLKSRDKLFWSPFHSTKFPFGAAAGGEYIVRGRRGDQMFSNVFNRCGIVDGQTDMFESDTGARETGKKRIEVNGRNNKSVRLDVHA